MKRGKIWLLCLDPTLGHEPAVILRGRQVFAVPLTGAGTKTTGVVRCDQPRALDLAARGGKKLESVPDAIIDEVLAKISPIFE